MTPTLSPYCANCGHHASDHPDWKAGGCRVQTRGNAFGDDDYCACRAFVEQWCVFHTEADGLAMNVWRTADGQTFVILKDPWERRRLDGTKLTWLAEQLPAAVSALAELDTPTERVT